MNTGIGKALNIKKISDLRLQIAFAKEYVPMKESQEGLFKLVKTIIDSVKGIFELIQLCFDRFFEFAEVFIRKPDTVVKTNDEIIPKNEIEKQDKKVLDKKLGSHLDLSDFLDEIEREDEIYQQRYKSLKDKLNKKEDVEKVPPKDKQKDTLEDLDYKREVEIFTKTGLTPAIVHILDKIWQLRFEVNPMSVYIIEFMYQWINENERNIKICQINRPLAEKFLKEFEPTWKIISEKSDGYSNEKDETLEEYLKTFKMYISQIFDIAQSLSNTKYEETFTLQLSQTPIFHIKDILIYQEKKGYYQGDLRNLVKTIIVEYQYLFEDNQIREITEWLDNSVVSNQVSYHQKPNIKDNRLIKIKTEYIIPIANAFSDHFDEAEMSIFIRLLEGEKSDYKVKFNGGSAQLVYAFRILKENKIISNLKKDIVHWLIDYFQFASKDTKKFDDLKYNSVHYSMTRSENKGFKIPKDAIFFTFIK